VHFDCEQSELLPKRISSLVKNVSFFRYCTEFSLSIREVKNKDYFVDLLAKRGDSIVVALNENVLKVHIHTNRPHEIMDEFSKYGSFISKKIDDLFMTQEFESLKLRKHKGYAIAAFTDGEGIAATLEQLGADVAFSIPAGYCPGEEEIKMLIDEFLKENLIIFPTNKEMCERLKRIQEHSRFQNVYVADSDSLPKSFFLLSSLVFSDEFKNIIKSFEDLKKQRIFETSVRTVTAENNQIQYSGYLNNKIIIKDEFTELLNAVAGEDALKPYSAVVVFGGKDCKPEDIESIHAHFEKNDNLEFAYFDGRQQDCDFIVGAY